MLSDQTRAGHISKLELSVRSNNALENAGYSTIGKLEDLFFQKSKREVLMALPHFGAKSYREVLSELHRLRGTGETPEEEYEFRRWCDEHRRQLNAVRDGRAAIVPLFPNHEGSVR